MPYELPPIQGYINFPQYSWNLKPSLDQTHERFGRWLFEGDGNQSSEARSSQPHFTGKRADGYAHRVTSQHVNTAETDSSLSIQATRIIYTYWYCGKMLENISSLFDRMNAPVAPPTSGRAPKSHCGRRMALARHWQPAPLNHARKSSPDGVEMLDMCSWCQAAEFQNHVASSRCV